MYGVRRTSAANASSGQAQTVRGDRLTLLQASLSSRESDVLELVAEGLSNEGIANRLFISPKTVESALSSVFLKLGLGEDGRDGNRRVKAAMYFVSLQTAPSLVPLGHQELTALLTSAPFDTVVNVLEQRAADAAVGAWGLLAAASWCLAISDDLDHAVVLAERSSADIDTLVATMHGPDQRAARVIVDGLIVTLTAMRGAAPLSSRELDDVATLAALPLRHHERAVFDAMESVLEIANWFTFSDRPAEAAAILDRRLDRVDDFDDFSQNSALCCLGELEIRRGRWQRCDDSLQRLLQRERAVGQSSGYAHALAARLSAGRGDTASARAHLRAARTAATARGDHSTRWRTDAAEGLLRLGLGDADGAAKVLGPLVGRADGAGLRLPSVRMWEADLVEAQVRCGDAAGARLTTKWLMADVEATGSRWGAAALMRCHGLLALSGAAAISEFESSTDLFGRIDAPFEQARSELLLGSSLAGSGRDVAATMHISRARDLFESIGAAPWAAAATSPL